MEKVTLSCTKCGGSLEITPDVEIFKCQYCDTPYLVHRSEGGIRLKMLEERVETVEERHAELEGTVLFSEIQRVRELIAERLESKRGGRSPDDSELAELYRREWEL